MNLLNNDFVIVLLFVRIFYCKYFLLWIFWKKIFVVKMNCYKLVYNWYVVKIVVLNKGYSIYYVIGVNYG